VTPSASPDQANADLYNATLPMSSPSVVRNGGRALLLRILDDPPDGSGAKAVVLCTLLVVANVAVLIWALVSLLDYPLLFENGVAGLHARASPRNFATNPG